MWGLPLGVDLRQKGEEKTCPYRGDKGPGRLGGGQYRSRKKKLLNNSKVVNFPSEKEEGGR